MKKINKIVNKFLQKKYNFERKYGQIEIGNINSRAAEVGFYLLLSLFPFLLFTISAVVFIPIIYLNKYINILESLIPSSAFIILNGLIRSVIGNRSIKLLISSFFLAIWSISKAVKSLIRGINRSYGVNENRSFFKVLFISLIFSIMLLLLILISLVLLIGGEKIGTFVFDLIGLDKYFIYIWNILRYSVGILFVISILVILYTYMPNTKMKVRDSVPGAVLSTFLWIIVTYGYSFYVNNFSNYDVIYGSLGGVIVLITWLYLSSWTILAGSELNARLLYKKRNRTKIRK
ncbi:MAG: YihY/virulence factor BrkB family protein, partial [Intestinibacter bartlettii]